MIKQDTIEGIREEVEKTARKLSLRVKNFKQENAEKLNQKKGVSIIELKEKGKHIQVLIHLKEKLIPWVTDTLVSDGVKIFSIEPQKNSLEDIFLKEIESDNDD